MHSEIEPRKRKLLAASAVGVATAICLFGHLGAIGLVGPDDPRYAWIARAMAESGNWVTPRLYGGPWFEKPILYYWAAAIGFRLHLPDEWAARLPSALAALMAALTIAWVARQHFDRDQCCPWSPALLAPLLFATSVAAIGFSRAATPDMLFAASITIAMACAAAVLRRVGALGNGNERQSRPAGSHITAVLLLGISLGLAVLAKGPAALILAGGAAGLWAVTTGKWKAAFRLLDPFAVAAFCGVALPWYVLCAHRNPDFIRVFIFQHNFERYLTPFFQHRQPFWFFVPITLLAVVPWIAFIVSAARDGMRLWRTDAWRESPGFFFSCWAVFPILFFSFSQSKLPSYILPTIPALALVLAVVAARLLQNDAPGSAWIFAMLGMTWIGLGIGAWVWLQRLPESIASPAKTPILSCALLAIAGGITIVILARNGRRAAIWISLVLVCVSLEIAGMSILPKLDVDYSARHLGTMLQRDLRPDRLFEYQLPRAWQYGLAFYLKRPLPEWFPEDRQAALVLTTRSDCDELRRQGLTQTNCGESEGPIVIVPLLARPAKDAPRSNNR